MYAKLLHENNNNNNHNNNHNKNEFNAQGYGGMIEIPAIEITKDGTGENGDGDDDECEYSIVETPSSVGRRRSSANHSQQHQQQVRSYSPHVLCVCGFSLTDNDLSTFS